jgi:hypothetical protein
MARKHRNKQESNSNRLYVILMLATVVLYYAWQQYSMHSGVSERNVNGSQEMLRRIARDQNGEYKSDELLFANEQQKMNVHHTSKNHFSFFFVFLFVYFLIPLKKTATIVLLRTHVNSMIEKKKMLERQQQMAKENMMEKTAAKVAQEAERGERLEKLEREQELQTPGLLEAAENVSPLPVESSSLVDDETTSEVETEGHGTEVEPQQEAPSSSSFERQGLLIASAVDSEEEVEVVEEVEDTDSSSSASGGSSSGSFEEVVHEKLWSKKSSSESHHNNNNKETLSSSPSSFIVSNNGVKTARIKPSEWLIYLRIQKTGSQTFWSTVQKVLLLSLSRLLTYLCSLLIPNMA